MFVQVLLKFYFHPRQAMDAIAQLTTPRYGAFYALIRGALLAIIQYLPFYLLRFTPLTPAYLSFLDTPDYFLYAACYWPIFIVLSWIYLTGCEYVVLRLLNYKPNLDQMLNLSGLLNLAIGIVIIAFDWLMVAINFHTNAVFLGIAHMVIADPWSITLTAIFYKKYFGVPAWLTVLLGILVRILYMPLAIAFIRT